MPKIKEPVRYLSRPQLAERIGVKPDTVNRYNLPTPDAYVGDRPGWLAETVDRWQANRPRPRNAPGN